MLSAFFGIKNIFMVMTSWMVVVFSLSLAGKIKHWQSHVSAAKSVLKFYCAMKSLSLERLLYITLASHKDRAVLH